MNLLHNKLKTAVITSILALCVSNSALANDTYDLVNNNTNSSFRVFLGNHSTEGNSQTKYYLYYTPNDTTIGTIHLKGGTYYIATEYTSEAAARDEWTYYSIGNASMSEDELKQAIDDAVHNVDGDQTVDGNQQVTGDQTVDGSQTVTGGQTISGGFIFTKSRAVNRIL